MDQTKRKIALALLVAMFLAAFEGTVIATAAPVIVRDLAGFELVSWIFSLYLLTSAISTPIYGKLADLYGRKNILCLGILIFLIGSALCGFSRDMRQLVAFRALQGLGAGAILTVTFTVIGDVFTLKERAVVQGGISTVWGIAGLIGPLIGGFLIDALSWHWIFFINVPFALLCIAVLRKYLADPFVPKHPKIDYAGAAALSCVIGSFLYAVMIDARPAGGAPPLFALSLLAFYKIEKSAAEPIVPFALLTKSAAAINGVTFFVAMILIATTVYLPLYIQSVLGYSATVAGLALASMSVSWFISSTLIARGMEAYGARRVVLGAASILLLACALLAALTADSSLAAVSGCAFIFGFGFSGTLNTLTFMVQDSVGYEKRGAAVGINALTRTLAQTIGVSVCGTLLNRRLADYLQQHEPTAGLGGVAAAQNALSAATMQNALFASLHFVFLTLIAAAAIALLLALLLPRGKTAVPHPAEGKS